MFNLFNIVQDQMKYQDYNYK